MVYCTIEEAWTQSLNPELENTPINDNNINYNINGSADLYEIDPPHVKKKRIPNKSRTYNKLPGHQSKSDRLGKSKVHKINNKEGVDDPGDQPYRNMTSPENEYNIKMYDDYNDKARDLDSTVSIMEDFQDNLPVNENMGNSVQFLEIINELRAENKRLVTTITDLQNSAGSISNKDNFMDIIIFITAGIIIILMMENITKLMRRF
jgi:hypothetical protein